MLKAYFRRSFVAVMVLVSLLLQGTWALAGTTGNISGTVTDTATSAPIANAKVTVTSPSQSNFGFTDSTGHFNFLSVSPDSYTVSVDKQGYNPTSLSGVTVFADQTQNIALKVQKSIREIGRVTSRASSDVVKPGTTSDVYSVSGAVAEKATALGGGNNINNAYSQMAAVPGVFVEQGGNGYGNGVFIRGGNFDQIGFEYDGVPVTRAFDNYASGGVSNLGQQELQVYTGGTPASSSTSGLAGFINQVIKTGTYPGYGQFQASTGGPSFYHQLQFELGGATPNRNFSYYIGLSGYNQDFRNYDQWNGGGGNINTGYVSILNNPSNNSANGLTTGAAAGPCVNGASTYNAATSNQNADPGCFAFGPGIVGYAAGLLGTAGGAGLTSDLFGRDGVVNLHFGIPHKNDGGKDDIQLLYSSSFLLTKHYGSVSDIGAANLQNAFGSLPTYTDARVFPNGTTFGQPAAGLKAVNYFEPGAPGNRAPGAAIPTSQRDGFSNRQDIVKLQYQKNMGSSAYARIFGYTFYSDWIYNGQVSTWLGNQGSGVGPGDSYDYELLTHTRGVELQVADQINSKNLLTATANYTTAAVIRANNTTFLFGNGTRATNLADANGNCYLSTTGALAPCNSNSTRGTFGTPVPANPIVGAAAAAGAQYIVTENTERATFNTVVPKFSSFSLTDQWKPTDKLLFNLGVRFEQFQYNLANTQTPDKNFWFAAAQKEFCYDPVTLQPIIGNGGGLPRPSSFNCPVNALTGNQTVHPDGLNGHLLLSNTYGSTITQNVTSPRLAMTYTVNPDNVIRASYGKYPQAVNTAFLQYNTKQANLPGSLLFPRFWRVGFTTPRHDIRLPTSNNSDISWEHHFKGTDMSFKATPFLRTTKDQIEQVVLDATTGFVSGLNAGAQTSSGLEFQVTKGDFNRNGFAAFLAYTYTNSKLKYTDFAPGRNAIDVVNDAVNAYNRLTRAGGGAPCYANTGDGTADPACGATSIRNPYYAMNSAPLFDRNGNYAPVETLPAGPGADATTILIPHVFNGLVQWKKDKLTITPSFQLDSGPKYGMPVNVAGIDPRTCTQNSALIPSAPSVNQADYTSCGGTLTIPNPQDGNRFSNFGAFQEPWHLNIGTEIAYEFTPKVKGRLLLANIVNNCFGGTQAAWTTAFPAGNQICGYNGVGSGGTPLYVSNFYNGSGPLDRAGNGGNVANPAILQSYAPSAYNSPFQFYFQLQVKL